MNKKHHRLSPRQKARAHARLPQACAQCGTGQHLTIDHKLARALGGTNALENLQVLCTTCNRTKAAAEYRLAAEAQRLRFAAKAVAVWGAHAYDYSQVLHAEGRGNIKIICLTHGVFWCTPAQHLAGSGCPQCAAAARKAARQQWHLARYGPRARPGSSKPSE